MDVAAMFNDDDIVYAHGFLCPRTILRMRRLLLFVRVVAKCPPFLLELIAAQCKLKKGWASSLASDLRWLCTSTKFAECTGWDISQWAEYVQAHPKVSAKQISAFCKSPFANICAQWAVSPVLQAFAQPIACTACGRISKSSQAHSVHMFRSHGIKCMFRRYIPHTHCLVCLREFWSRERCLNHAKKSKVCRSNLLLLGPCLSQEEADALDQDCKVRNRELHAAGRRRHATDLSSVRLQGPLQPIIVLESHVSSHHPLGVGQRHN